MGCDFWGWLYKDDGFKKTVASILYVHSPLSLPLSYLSPQGGYLPWWEATLWTGLCYKRLLTARRMSLKVDRSGIFPVAMQCKLAREKGSFFKKEKNQEMGTLPSFIDWKIGAPERNKCLELLTLLPYHISTQSDGHTHHCQNTPRYWAWRQVSSLTGYGVLCWGFIWVHKKDSSFACTWCLCF